MKLTIIAAMASMCFATAASAQQVFVYPQKGQDQKQQDVDTAECQRWAKANSGVDPNAPQQPDQVGSHARGTAGGAARGAAGGAAVGAIAGDAGKGAAIGAVVGAARGRRGSKQQKQDSAAQQTDNFQRAFGACMEGRGYTVK